MRLDYAKLQFPFMKRSGFALYFDMRFDGVTMGVIPVNSSRKLDILNQ